MRISLRQTFITLTLTALVVACATSPLGRRQFVLISDGEVTQAGVASFKDMQKKLPQSKDARQVAYVNCVAAAIVDDIPRLQTKGTLRVPSSWEVSVFDSKDVNAFALPGGKIGVYTGLLKIAATQDQLAAVIGHEVSHVLAGHSAERYSETMASQVGSVLVQATTGVNGQLIDMATNAFILLPFSRTHETEADLLGLDLMAGAGFDPRQSIALWQNMARAGGSKPAEFMSSHPSDETRIRNLSERLNTAMPIYEQAKAAGRQPRCS
ncbi:MAG: M48 family metallopeptidase [Stagnimonas sp.]|nr:M48 family metallopeptidase [Stagnimonas sp.]